MAAEVRLPQAGMGMQDGTVLEWFKRPGDAVEAGELLAEVEAAKATVEITAPMSGILARILVAEGATVPVRDLLALITAPGETLDDEPAAAATLAPPTAAPPSAPRPVQITPVARRLAKEHGIALDQVAGSGPGGRITEADIRALLDAGGARGTEAPAAAPPTTVPLSGIRGVIARRMHDSLQTMAQLTLTTEVDVTELADQREALKERLAATWTDVVVRACALVLPAHPRLNATVEGDRIHLLPDIHIGIAVALDDGLVVPVLRDAGRKSLRQTAEENRALVTRAQQGRATAEELGGSTFTVSNLGGYGVDAFTPIINPPEVAILGVGRVVERPARHDGELVWRRVLTLSLTFDHRAVDGAPAAAFLSALAGQLRDPAMLLSDSSGELDA
jgi:pyruvate dehydrogenase E2 component (dihydrolipoamide acetyltransferase)